jgi:amidase
VEPHPAVRLHDPDFPLDGESDDLLQAAVDALAAAGATVDDRAELPCLAEGHAVAQQLIQGSMSHSIPDEEFERLLDVATSADPDDDSPPVRWARNITQPARDLNRVREHRARLQTQWADVFRDYDTVLCPVTPTAAFPHDHRPADDRRIPFDETTIPYSDQFAWLQSTGVVRLPSVAAPVGRTRSGLPVGIQIVGPPFEDHTAIDVARNLAMLIGGYTPPPTERLTR